MKIALVHDYIKEYGGAERVLETLHELYPDAPVFTLVYCPEFLGPHKKRFAQWDIRPSFLQFVPFKEKLISPFRLIAPFVFPLFNFAGYNVILVSATGAYSPNTIKKQTAKQICYYHTPPRYLYGYATAREWKKYPVMRFLGEVANHFLRIIDDASSQNVDIFLANSENVKERIKKFYRKDAIVVYPPVDVSSLSFSRKRESSQKRSPIRSEMTKQYYLAGGRLARPKHIDILVKAATNMKIPLKVFGKDFAGYGEELQKIAGPTVTFVGEVSDEEKMQLMKGAKAFLFAGEDEDFGITPVEAMRVGTPVIAYKSGGVLETVIDKKTGIFFSHLTPYSVEKAIKMFTKTNIVARDCQNQAKLFTKEKFLDKIQRIVKKNAENQRK